MRREVKISLEDYIHDGKFPKGEYVSLEVRWILGPYATETKTETTNGISATAGMASAIIWCLKTMRSQRSRWKTHQKKPRSTE